MFICKKSLYLPTSFLLFSTSPKISWGQDHPVPGLSAKMFLILLFPLLSFLLTNNLLPHFRY